MADTAELISFVKTHLLGRTEYYDLYGQLDDLSGGAKIDDIEIIDISYDNSVDGRTQFLGTLLIKAVKDVGITSISFTGIFEGYFDETDIYLESASLDVSTTSGEGHHSSIE